MTDLTMSQFASKDDLLAAQAARIAELEAELEAVGAGGVQRLAAAPQAVQAAVPDAWAAVHFGGKRNGKIYNTCDTEKECNDYIAMVHQQSDSTTLTAKPVFFAAAPAHPAEGVPAQIETLRSELAEEKEAADNWRRLALQFDNHRLQALWHLKRILHADSSVDEHKAAEQFLAAPPLDGEAVLAQRIAALAATQPAAQGVEALPMQASEGVEDVAVMEHPEWMLVHKETGAQKPLDSQWTVRATQPAAQGAATTGYIAPKGRYVPPVLFSPYTGEPRDARDIASDPRGILIVPPGAALAAQAKQGGAA